jgi:hypothetical protein
MQSITHNFIQYYHGNLPLVLTAPHGGFEDPNDIDDRTQGVFEQDNHTLELTTYIIKAFRELTGKIPYGIIATILRKKVDLNRKESQAYEDWRAKKVYDEFHYRIKQAQRSIQEHFGKGLYIDIHGQSHPNACLEFGYLLDNDTLKLNDTTLSQYQNQSSIKTLSRFSPASFLDQLKGEKSLGTLMSQHGYPSIPSQTLPFATDGNYFEGAYDTIRYGSLEGGNISGIQIEFPYPNVRDSHSNMQKCAHAFAQSIITFCKVHLGLDLYA